MARTKQDAASDGTAAEPQDSLPSRIEPVMGEDGKPVELAPPCGTRWIRDVDGGLTPADADTAAAAGLAWPG